MATAIVPSPLAFPDARSVENPALLDLLILDHEPLIREACREAAANLGYRTSTAESVEQGLWLIESESIDVVLLGLKLPSSRQSEILRQIKHRRPGIEIIVMAGHSTVESAVDAMKAGAFDYVAKPFGLAELKTVLERAANHLKIKTENRPTLEKNRSTRGFGSMIGRTSAMEKLYRMIGKAAQSTHPVLVTGESGTGKEMVARAVHYSGPFRDKPFVPVDCGALVPSLIESELFGYVKGAFTGAMQSKPGLLAIAEGGTVFLDEIGELPVDLQAKLLRAFQEREIRPIGSTKQVPINIRILAATNRDLEEAVTQGSFRRDLYFRLNVLSLRVPSLRERREDIPLLVGSFLERLSRASGRNYEISGDAISALLAYEWPGNVRELESCIERCCAMSSEPFIRVTDLCPSITKKGPQKAETSPEEGIVPIAELEKQAILAAIAQLNGDRLTAAKLLGIGKTTLYRKLKAYEESASSSRVLPSRVPAPYSFRQHHEKSDEHFASLEKKECQTIG